MKNTRDALKLTPPDARDFKLGAIMELPALSELPQSFRLEGVIIHDQQDTDFCSAMMSVGMSELQEGVELSPEWAFAVSKDLSGDPESYGQDLRTALKVHTKYGAIERKDSPYTIANRDSNLLRKLATWEKSLFSKATKHIKQSFIKSDGKYDAFDDIRAAIWKFRNEKRSFGSGVIFGWDLKDKILDTIPKEGGGHAIHYIGWSDENHLIMVNSYGVKTGDKGVHYIHRDVVNFFVNIYGAYMFIDMSPEKIKYMIDNGITDKDNWILQLYKAIATLLSDLVKKNAMDDEKLALPVSKDFFEKISQHFAVEARGEYVSGIHPGTDWLTPIGTPLYALFDGKITRKAVGNATLGNAVFLSFLFKGISYTARYLHMSQLPTKTEFKKGELIGYSGNTGKVKGAHLHLDIQKNAPTFVISRIYTKKGVLEHMENTYTFIKQNSV